MHCTNKLRKPTDFHKLPSTLARLTLASSPLPPPPLQVCGVNQVIKIYMPPDERQIWDPTHGLVSLKGTGRRTLLADGANLMEIMACPDVDHTKTVCNDVMEVRGKEGKEETEEADLSYRFRREARRR